MEFMAWFSHKYIMHGFLWSLHKDHHKKDHSSWFERNDLFFIFYAVVSMALVSFGVSTAFGLDYRWQWDFHLWDDLFIVHDIFIHQRFKIFRSANS